MGGGISAIASVTKKLGVDEAFDLWGKALTSGEGELNKSKGGQWALKAFQEFAYRTKMDVANDLHPKNRPSLLQDLTTISDPKLRQQAATMNANLMHSVFEKNAAQNRSYIFGPKNAYLSRAIAAAKIERNTIHANNIRDIASIIFREEHPYPFTKAGVKTNWMTEGGVKTFSPYKSPDPEGQEKAIRSILGFAYLSRVVIPHTMQHFNVALSAGIKPWAQATADMLSKTGRDAARDFAWRSGAMYEEVYRHMRDVMEKRDTIWHKIFHMPGFSRVRQLEIIHAAIAGKYAAIDAAKSGGKAAELYLKSLGLDAQAIISRGSLTQDEMLKAGYRSADENLFIDRGIKTPWKWDSNSGWRMATLYKAFQFREGKLIKDSIIRAFKSKDPREVTRMLTMLGVVFPVAGELISYAENAATGRMPNDKSHIWRPVGNETADEYLDAMGHMAAFGIWYSLFRAGYQHRTTDWMSGPIVSFVADGATSLIALSKGKPKPAVKSIARRVPVVGPAIAAHVDDVSGAVSDTIDKLTE